jgi:hypothetical protein
MSPNDQVGYDELVKYESGVAIQYHGTPLAPSEEFFQLWSSIPDEYKDDLDIIRLGVVSHQLYEFENDLEIQSESGQSSFTDFSVSSKHTQGVVQEYAEKIRSNLGEEEELIINYSSYPLAVCDAVDEFLGAVCDDLDGNWSGVVKRFCKESGLSSDGDMENESSDPSSNNQRRQSRDADVDAAIVSNEHYL